MNCQGVVTIDISWGLHRFDKAKYVLHTPIRHCHKSKGWIYNDGKPPTQAILLDIYFMSYIVCQRGWYER